MLRFSGMKIIFLFSTVILSVFTLFIRINQTQSDGQVVDVSPKMNVA